MSTIGTEIRRLRIDGVSVNSATTDVAIFYGLPAKWRLRKFSVYDTSTSLAASLATLGVYTASSGSGNNLVALALLTSLTGSTKCFDMTLASIAGTDYQTGSNLYIRCGVAHGSAATVTVAIEIESLE